MRRIEETQLPGVGVRYDFPPRQANGSAWSTTAAAAASCSCSAADPDAVGISVDLSEDEARTVAEMMGVAPVVERLERPPADG